MRLLFKPTQKNVFKSVRSLAIVGSIGLSVAQGQNSSDITIRTPGQKRILATYEIVTQHFLDSYAPRGWKKSHRQFDLEERINFYKNKILENPEITQKDFHRILKSFEKEFADYHVGFVFSSQESAKLPFTMLPVEGQFLVVAVDRAIAPVNNFPINVGDAIVAFDKIPLEKWIASPSVNVAETDRILETFNLTNRRAKLGHMVPKGHVVIDYIPAGTQEVRSLQYVWDYTAETLPEIGNRPYSELAPKNSEQRPIKSSNLVSNPKMQYFDFEVPTSNGYATSFSLGARTSYIPRVGKVLWEAPENSIFDSYLSLANNGKVVGVLRIPNYTPVDAVSAVKEFAQRMADFEKKADVLILDQINNPGGSVFYLYALLAHLTDRPLKTPKHRMTITPERYSESKNILSALNLVDNDAKAREAFGETLGGFPVTYNFLLNYKLYTQFIIDQWDMGRRLSDPHHIYGVDQINPASQPFTKPILLVVNSLDFSGGDFFPAILQDNKRATIFGSRTAGAGGYVTQNLVPNNLGLLIFTITESIAERADLNPIENLGVVPDINYSLKVLDIQSSGFQNYGKEVLNAALKLLN